ncbi:MAG TPA: GNAT family N-acetyltransferase, partial [Thalassospira lucentensis]|nr:GNAT family N-acetyltransferase [Thalassospira lucentensis]
MLGQLDDSQIGFRLAHDGDLDALCDIENRSFDIDRLSRRAFKRFIGSETARLRVA